jgi:hypothetical protein
LLTGYRNFETIFRFDLRTNYQLIHHLDTFQCPVTGGSSLLTEETLTLFVTCVFTLHTRIRIARIWMECDKKVFVPKLINFNGLRLVEALRYKPAGRGFDSGWCQWIFSFLSVALWPWGRLSL